MPTGVNVKVKAQEALYFSGITFTTLGYSDN
jgi:Ion channel